ncbi:hypothetical protein NIES2109_61890 (plasmid) [Nostoc sp. HK-01]|nr:hypothetical protein NIES2109_61890 [Nostoc sp. HK-01]
MDFILEIPPDQQAQSWECSQSLNTPATRFNAYLNQLALLTVLPQLEEIWETKATSMTHVWELINGTAIDFNGERIVIIPSDAIDLSELRVPSEWVDIPSWTADYYLAVQVNVEDGIVRVWGHTTHLQLKQQGSYNERDRTYSLENEQITPDINLLKVICQFCPDAVTRSEIKPLPDLSIEGANDLIQRLGNSAIVFPGRAVDFDLWGALLQNDEWRQRLLDKRSFSIVN